MWTENFQMFNLGLEKAEKPEIKLSTFAGSLKKWESSRKRPTSALLITPKLLTVWITTNGEKFLKRYEYQTTLPASGEIWMQVKKQVRIGHGTTDWFQIRKGVLQGCILSPWLFNLYAEHITWNARLDEAQAGVTIAGRNINNLTYADDITLMTDSEEGIKKPCDEWEESEKLVYNSTFKKLRSWHPVLSLHGKQMGKQWQQCFWAPKSLQIVTAATKLKDAYSLEGKLWPA